MIVCDENDPDSIQAAKSLTGLPTTIIVEEQKFAVEKWNIAAKRCTGDFMSPQGDDNIFETKDWDLKILSEFNEWPSTIGLVCCADGVWNGKFATNMFISREWYLAIGLFPKELKHNFCDRWMDDIAKIIKRWKYTDKVMMRHYHFAFDKSVENDATYQIQEPHKAADKAFYNNTRALRACLAGELFKKIREMEK